MSVCLDVGRKGRTAISDTVAIGGLCGQLFQQCFMGMSPGEREGLFRGNEADKI